MSDFIEYLHEVFTSFGAIEAKRMFGGYGIYHDGLMFALVADNILYLKADAQSAKDFEALGLARFEYDKSGKTVYLSYYAAPEEVFDDPDAAQSWARRAHQAALRSKKK